jgi:hypothetical protein
MKENCTWNSEWSLRFFGPFMRPEACITVNLSAPAVRSTAAHAPLAAGERRQTPIENNHLMGVARPSPGSSDGHSGLSHNEV